MSDESKPGFVGALRSATVLFKEVMQSVLIMVLALFAIATYANPPWAHQQLRRMGFDIKEISVAGIKLVVSQSFTLAGELAEAEQSLASARDALKAAGATGDSAHAALTTAIQRVSGAQAALVAQENGTKKLQEKAGVQPVLPAWAWVTVGRLTESGQLQPAARIDARGTRIDKGQVRQVTLRQAAIVRDEDTCTRTDIANAAPPSAEEMQRVVMLMNQGRYEATETHTCPSIGGGRILSARIAVTADRVRLSAFEDAKR